MNRADPKMMRRLNDSGIRSCVQNLLKSGFVERPCGTKRKGIGITELGIHALSTTLTQRKPTGKKSILAF